MLLLLDETGYNRLPLPEETIFFLSLIEPLKVADLYEHRNDAISPNLPFFSMETKSLETKVLCSQIINCYEEKEVIRPVGITIDGISFV